MTRMTYLCSQDEAPGKGSCSVIESVTPHEGGGPCVPGSKVHPPFAGNWNFMTGLKHVVWCYHEPRSSTTTNDCRLPVLPRGAGAPPAPFSSALGYRECARF